jgi:hypothetical protein
MQLRNKCILSLINIILTAIQENNSSSNNNNSNNKEKNQVYQDFTLLGCSYPSATLHGCLVTKDEDSNCDTIHC